MKNYFLSTHRPSLTAVGSMEPPNLVGYNTALEPSTETVSLGVLQILRQFSSEGVSLTCVL
jgi:hypothetical protein